MRIIITGVSGMVGEGVLLECLNSSAVEEILMINRRHVDITHAKLKELLVPDFLKLENHSGGLEGFDACFFCAGISSVGMSEEDYTKVTYDTTVHFATVLANINPNMVFTYVTGAHTDGSEQGKVMWARVKGKTENALMKLPFPSQYNFRPGFMKPVEGQKNVRWFFKPVIAIYPLLFPKKSLTLNQIAQAMIRLVSTPYSKQVLEIEDIRAVARK
jgi:nucleoside-diphosphate-sugar epimerase